MNSPVLATSTHVPPTRSVRQIMATVLLALLPAVLARAFLVGPAVLMQIAIATLFALACEASMLKLRGQPMAPFLTDFSAPLTAVLFALCIPPLAPWWIAAIGMCVAIVFAKHLFGGLGHNLFNPAMAGVVVARLCFPQEFADWLPVSPIGIAISKDVASHVELWIAVLYALGGIYLLWKKLIPWQTPTAALVAAILLACAFETFDPNLISVSLLSVFPGALILAAFFIVTDPVTGCASPRGRLIFGAGVGALAVAIHHLGEGIASIAFAVLLMNCAAPWIDRRTRPNKIIAGRQDSPA